MIKALLILVIVSLSNTSFARSHDDIFNRYKTCVDQSDSTINEITQYFRDDLIHQDLLEIWAQEFLPKKALDHAYNDLMKKRIRFSKELLAILRERLRDNKYEQMQLFIKSKLSASKNTQCRLLIPYITQAMQDTIAQAWKLEQELTFFIELSELNNDVEEHMERLMNSISEISSLRQKLESAQRE